MHRRGNLRLQDNPTKPTRAEPHMADDLTRLRINRQIAPRRGTGLSTTRVEILPPQYIRLGKGYISSYVEACCQERPKFLHVGLGQRLNVSGHGQESGTLG